jgi:hypothetical protein
MHLVLLAGKQHKVDMPVPLVTFSAKPILADQKNLLLMCVRSSKSSSFSFLGGGGALFLSLLTFFFPCHFSRAYNYLRYTLFYFLSPKPLLLELRPPCRHVYVCLVPKVLALTGDGAHKAGEPLFVQRPAATHILWLTAS